MPLLAANRKVLAARFPETLAALESAAPAPVAARADTDDTPFVAHVAGLRRTLVVLTGVPSPATAAALLRAAPPEILFWSVEPTAAPLAAQLASDDLSFWFADPRVFLSIGPPTHGELRRLNREFAWIDNARAVPIPSRCNEIDEPWRAVLAPTLARLRQRWQNVFTDLKLSPVRFENTCANLPDFLAQPDVGALAGAFAGTTLVLVAAGPSLDDALPFLEKIRDRALIVTGNTSFRALASRGVPPHLTVSVDPFPTTALGYVGQPTEHTHLVAPVFVHRDVPARFPGRLFGLADESLLLARLRRAAGLPPAPPIVGEGTVSATILNLAAHLGCARVIFVGQDFAIADDGRTHASNTFYTDLGCNQQSPDRLHELPGTTRPIVRLTEIYLWYLRIVEHFVARHPEIHFSNTSHRGAVITGAPFVGYDQAAAELAAAPVRDFAAELGARHTAAIRPAAHRAMTTELARIRHTAGEAAGLALAAALTGELAVTQSSATTRRQFDQAGRNFEQWRATRTADEALLFEGRTKPEIFAAEKRRVALPPNLLDLPLRAASEVAWAYAEGTIDLHRQLQALSIPA